MTAETVGWTGEKERAFAALLKEREANQKRVYELQFVKALRTLADDIEAGKENLTYEYKIEYLRHTIPGYPDELGPVHGRRFTLTLAGDGYGQ